VRLLFPKDLRQLAAVVADAEEEQGAAVPRLPR
jgi:hypothetical protein